MSKISNNDESQENINNTNTNDISEYIILNSEDNKNIEKSTITEITKESEQFQNSIDTIEINKINNSLQKPFINIDSKNYFMKSDMEKSDELYKKFKTKYDIKILSENLKVLSTKIKDKILGKIFPGIKQDFFSISLSIVKILDKESLLNKKNLEKNLNFFFLNNALYADKSTILIDYNFIYNCGPLIAFAYKGIKKYKIIDNISFINAINKIINDNIDVKQDFDLFYSSDNKKQQNVKKTKYFKKIKNNYIIKPELIYLMNLFSSTRKIIIDINIPEKEYKSYIFYFYILCLLNFPYIIKSINCIKFEIMNETLFKYRKEENEKKLINENCLFKNNIISKIISKKETLNEINNDYFLNQYKLINMKQKIQEENSASKAMEKLDLINIEDTKEDSPKFSDDNNCTINKKKEKIINLKKINNSDTKKALSKKDLNIEKHFIKKWFKSNDDEEDFSDKMLKLHKILEMIMITFFSFENFENLNNIELILVDTFYSEFLNYLNIKFQIQIDNFHILYLVYNKIIELKTLNLEINSFDIITFNEILSILYNSKATILKLSLFTKEFFYCSQFLYKVYRQGIQKKIIKEDKSSNDKSLIFNDRFFKNIYYYFEKNLNSLFEIIKNKEYKIFSISFNIPSPILNNDKFILVIIKFIMNIFILFFDNDQSITEDISIFSPSLVINGNKYLFIEEFLENNNIKNKKLLILDLNFKFYNIRNIHKFIPQNLIILNIGDFDISTFKYFVNNITQYKFVKNTSLQQLSIKINSTIIKYNEEIQLTIAKLFNINIESLLICLYTNIEINLSAYQEIINILQDNLIHAYNLSFNKYSEQLIKDNYQQKEKLICIEPKEPGYSKMINVLNSLDGTNEKQTADFPEINLCLKYKVNNIVQNNNIQIDFYTQKKIISNIFKYLFITNKPIVNFYEKET